MNHRPHESAPLLFAPAPKSNASPTSIAAAEDLAGKPRVLRGLRKRILDMLVEGGWVAGRWTAGATHVEISQATGIRLDTVKPRIHELGEMGLVRALKGPREGRLVFVASEHVRGRELEAWPIPRPNWKARAMEAERRAVEAEQRLEELQRARDGSVQGAA